MQKFQTEKPCHSNQFRPLWTKNLTQVQQSEKKIYQKAIIRCWGALPVNNDNAHIRLGFLKIFGGLSRTEKKGSLVQTLSN